MKRYTPETRMKIPLINPGALGSPIHKTVVSGIYDAEARTQPEDGVAGPLCSELSYTVCHQHPASTPLRRAINQPKDDIESHALSPVGNTNYRIHLHGSIGGVSIQEMVLVAYVCILPA